jgi:Ca-activated chloride channel family protein
MKRKRLKHFFLIAVLIAATGAAMAYSSKTGKGFFPSWASGSTHHSPQNNDVLRVSGRLVQNKVLLGSSGTVGLNLTLQAAEAASSENGITRNVDMVIVLDRSGSMQGDKIQDARRAVLKLLSDLSSKDRLALVTYSDGVRISSDLLNVTDDNRARMVSLVKRVHAGGGTNLGAGLQTGINILRSRNQGTNAAKVILISDGLANKGITDVKALAAIAGAAVEEEFSVSTVGVGIEFDEHLMTAIADRGTGSYYYLENPSAFAEVFRQEFFNTRAAVATNLKIEIPLQSGVVLFDAAGYPISTRNGSAVFYPGNLRSGQTRSLYLTLKIPTDSKRIFEFGNVKIHYRCNGRPYEAILDESFKIACIEDKKKVYSSIDETSWSKKSLHEDFNRLKQEVAVEIKAGEKQKALDKINRYHLEQEAANSYVGSRVVAEHLDNDIEDLKTFVQETFEGAPAAVQQKQKSNAKALQYEGYSGRRGP